MPPPVPIPLQRPATLDHRAGYVTSHPGHAPRCCPAPHTITDRGAAHGGTANENMTVRATSGLHPDKPDKSITSFDSTSVRARLVSAAGPVHFPRRDASQPHVRPLRAPYRAIAIPDPDRRAGELLTSRDNRHRSQQEHDAHHSWTTPSSTRSRLGHYPSRIPNTTTVTRSAERMRASQLFYRRATPPTGTRPSACSI